MVQQPAVIIEGGSNVANNNVYEGGGETSSASVELFEEDVIDGTFVSGMQQAAASNSQQQEHPDNNSQAEKAPQPIESVSLPPGLIHLQIDPDRRLSNNNNQGEEKRRRKLATYVGSKHTLIVKVTDRDGLSVPDSASTISDKFFGTYGDSENMKSQFESCSYDALSIDYDAVEDVSELSAPGVLEVTISISLDNPQHTIRGQIQNAVQEKLDIELPGPYDHVLYVLQGCHQDCGWAAYAYVNSWLSVYQGNYYKFPAVQLHEVGHNLNLAHSGGLNGETYTDHTCLMGNPLFSDSVGDMCFNPAKNYQIVGNTGDGNWYSRSRVETWDSNVHGKRWDGKLAGIADYGALPESDVDTLVVLKLERGSEDLYIGFNRDVGINSDVQEAPNEVTIIESGGEGLTYSQSFLKATLSYGESYTSSNWRGTGEDLVVTLNSITMSPGVNSPWYADVTVQLGDTPSPTEERTPLPTKLPTPQPTMNVSSFH